MDWGTIGAISGILEFIIGVSLALFLIWLSNKLKKVISKK